MSPDLAFKSVDGTNAEANLPRHLADADPLGQLSPCALDLVGFGTGPAQFRAHDAPLALELAVAGELILDDVQPSPDALADHGALKLTEGACDLEQQLAVGRGGIDVLLIEIQIDAHGLEWLDALEKVNPRSSQAVNGPGHHHVEFAPAGILEHAIKPRALVAAFGTAYAGVSISLHDGPAPALGNLLELADLVLN